MTQNVVPDLSALTIAVDHHGANISSLPPDILLKIISYLNGNLPTLCDLSRQCRVFSQVSRSDQVWRPICRALVGPWVHQTNLLSSQIPISDRPENPPAHPDWTQDPECFPVTHFAGEPGRRKFDSWYAFTTKYIIPRFQFLGWHISNKAPACELILNRYNVSSGEVIFENVQCVNWFSPIQAPQPEDPTDMGLPAWVPMNRLHLEDGLHYRILSDNNSPTAGCIYEIFKPKYYLSQILKLSPCDLNYVFKAALRPNVETWDNLYKAKIRHAEKIVAPRHPISKQLITKLQVQDGTDFVPVGTGPQQLHSFTFSRGVNRRDFFPVNGPIASSDYRPKAIDDGWWVGVDHCNENGPNIEFGKLVTENQANGHLQIRYLRLTGGRPEFIWQVGRLGMARTRAFPAVTLDQALRIDLGINSADESWLGGEAKSSIHLNHWLDVNVQFIKESEAESNESNIKQIRIHWKLENRVTNYFRVEFAS